MNLLDRYLFSQFTRNLLLVISSLMAIYLLVDFFEKVDNFLEAGLTTGRALEYLCLKIPLIFDQLLPVCLLLAGIITLGVLNHSHELMALKAGGISVRRVIRPILAATIIFTLLAAASSEWFLPQTIEATNRIWHEEVKKSRSQGIVRNGHVFFKGNHNIYSFRQPRDGETVFREFNYSAWDNEFRLQKQIIAARASWKDNIWTFTSGQIKKPDSNNIYISTTFTELSLPLPDRPEDFFLPEYRESEASLSDLAWEFLCKTDDRIYAERKLHKRLSYLFLGLPLVLLGLPMLLIVHQRFGAELTVAIPVSCLMAFGAWGWWSTAQSMTATYNLDPAMMSWSIHLLTGSLGLLLIGRQDR
ncbi:MAG: LptF/LptG family permease [Proteobacteria bacterium]|nr:LptF/LptG family permease [Pseudomonadota bacterium]MBU1738077.1 LptF/LptG family permease [Pseudomonadota bacterium]